MSNTEHLNRTIGLPPVSYSSPIVAEDGFHRQAAAKKFGIFNFSWKEYPFQWIRNERYAVLRLFEEGPLERVFGGIELYPEGQGTRIHVFAELIPGNFLGRLIIPLIGWKMARDTLKYCTKFLELSKSGVEDPLPRPRQRSRVSRTSLDDLLAKLAKQPVRTVLIPRLRHRLLKGSDEEVLRMQPSRPCHRCQCKRSPGLFWTNREYRSANSAREPGRRCSPD